MISAWPRCTPSNTPMVTTQWPHPVGTASSPCQRCTSASLLGGSRPGTAETVTRQPTSTSRAHCHPRIRTTGRPRTRVRRRAAPHPSGDQARAQVLGQLSQRRHLLAARAPYRRCRIIARRVGVSWAGSLAGGSSPSAFGRNHDVEISAQPVAAEATSCRNCGVRTYGSSLSTVRRYARAPGRRHRPASATNTSRTARERSDRRRPTRRAATGRPRSRPGSARRRRARCCPGRRRAATARRRGRR